MTYPLQRESPVRPSDALSGPVPIQGSYAPLLLPEMPAQSLTRTHTGVPCALASPPSGACGMECDEAGERESVLSGP